jgi:hypothetical protein
LARMEKTAALNMQRSLELEKKRAALYEARVKSKMYRAAKGSARLAHDILVAKYWTYTALDQKICDDGLTHGEIMADAGLDPAEVLMRKEESLS